LRRILFDQSQKYFLDDVAQFATVDILFAGYRGEGFYYFTINQFEVSYIFLPLNDHFRKFNFRQSQDLRTVAGFHNQSFVVNGLQFAPEGRFEVGAAMKNIHFPPQITMKVADGLQRVIDSRRTDFQLKISGSSSLKAESSRIAR
jgi:hypothetical protein